MDNENEMQKNVFAVGDQVVWSSANHWNPYLVWGRVTRVTPKGTVYAVDDHGNEYEFRARGRRTCRKPTEIEVAEDQWLARRPDLSHVHIVGGPLGMFRLSRVTVEDVTTVEQLRTAIDELQIALKWLEEDPRKHAR
ncbi:MAG: hypothetical protein ACTHU0_02670 [Kofleriaceae bacterium]